MHILPMCLPKLYNYRFVKNRSITELILYPWVDTIKVDVNEYARTMGSKNPMHRTISRGFTSKHKEKAKSK